MMLRGLFLCITIAAAFVCAGCGRQQTVPPVYLVELKEHRATVDSTMRHDPLSPFLRDSTISFTGIKWYPPAFEFRTEARLHRYPVPEQIATRGTRGEPRAVVRYGYLTFKLLNKDYRLNVHKFTEEELKKRGEDLHSYLMVWFTDKTNRTETYPVGRYLEIDPESPDSNHLYVLDFNKAYNPYCAYTTHYSCAVPTRDDVLDLAITAGEKKYHDDH
jgi:hypothetical protein